MKTIKTSEKIMKMHRINKIFLTSIKCLKLVLKHNAKNCIYNIIDNEKMLWLRNKNIGEKLGVGNIYNLIDKEIKERFETRNLTNEKMREYKTWIRTN